ncbi:M24 family metallopeptidase [Paramaledivibacter caminithermalis]|uniref:Xaa-Pro dipeptidase n=1 Tax=Paramaledivibacter caminithermalis (strain DSM 15212 / CIP 107654 / DViRD3) TaxID=1121301 RepID=A0A1M6K753_PARC5|nr:Xaa-Pro peptidase family protein [Paramaledivibacter caminithermalis]SHJ54818.1 Xaa-Pro dipeptidase [Paramaledivibacter caminithermalis DSM 15212]
MLNKKYIDKLIGIIKDEKLDAMFIAPSEDLEFLMGFSPHMDERFQGLFITKDGQLFYIVPKLNREEILDTLGNNGKVFDWGDGEGFLGVLAKSFEEYNLLYKTIGVNGTARAVNMLDIKTKLEVDLKNGKQILEELRIIKSGEEIEKLRVAAKMADDVFEQLVEFIKPGILERDIKDKIGELFMEMGADGLSFEPIVASGPNSSKPHYNKDSRVIEEKDIIILDFGCKYKGLCSDMSRTVFVGDISKEEKKIYDIVYRANEAAEKYVKEGVAAESVDKVARNIIKEEGHGEHFLNRVGHGIGYSVHEAPYIKGGNERKLQKGMAFSIEPGIYIPGKFGMRIEDIVVISEKGVEILNKAPKEIIVIK